MLLNPCYLAGPHSALIFVQLLQVNATQDVEARICERLHIGGHVTYRRLLEDMQQLGYSGNQVGLGGVLSV